jgi:hypothetical protein
LKMKAKVTKNYQIHFNQHSQPTENHQIHQFDHYQDFTHSTILQNPHLTFVLNTTDHFTTTTQGSQTLKDPAINFKSFELLHATNLIPRVQKESRKHRHRIQHSSHYRLHLKIHRNASQTANFNSN